MNPSQFKPFKWYSFYDDSIYNQIFENLTPSYDETVLYFPRAGYWPTAR